VEEEEVGAPLAVPKSEEEDEVGVPKWRGGEEWRVGDLLADERCSRSTHAAGRTAPPVPSPGKLPRPLSAKRAYEMMRPTGILPRGEPILEASNVSTAFPMANGETKGVNVYNARRYATKVSNATSIYNASVSHGYGSPVLGFICRLHQKKGGCP